ncbi:uncharacterized protein LOC114522436 isoform X2 [Dendronephthya gigantea]|uniref:uncharacterized protein LOC114522436 isoform X2 n=1 Tax=Dendronephthya gigantea TaxID=151771 RepID=UPI00106BC229|nr:uncharacterized protein LOC114522436 isoform X2 [Dendronephthya gigantea]
MKVIILAAGYGTRLEKDIKNDPKQRYKHLLGIPKPLFPVGGECLISRWISILKGIREDSDCKTNIDKIILLTNHHFVGAFSTWAKQWAGTVEVLDDGTTTNETRMGAVADIEFCIEYFKIDDDILIIGGDTLFYKDFDLQCFLNEFYSKNLNSLGGALVTCYHCKDSDTKRSGILELDKENKVVAFLEKPDPDSTSSRWACPCFYVFSRKSSQLIAEFLREKMNAPLEEKDAPGHLIKFLQGKVPMYAVPLKSGRFDIGHLETYIECDQYFSEVW